MTNLQLYPKNLNLIKYVEDNVDFLTALNSRLFESELNRPLQP